MGLGGGMIWALDLDDFRDRCGCEPHPLLRTINRELRGYHIPDPNCPVLGGKLLMLPYSYGFQIIIITVIIALPKDNHVMNSIILIAAIILFKYRRRTIPDETIWQFSSCSDADNYHNHYSSSMDDYEKNNNLGPLDAQH